MSDPFVIIFGMVIIVLALPGLIDELSVKRFFVSLFACIFGVALPLAVFFLSALLVPEWKGGCKHGWIDCFHLGKLALTPLVLWATLVLYAVEVWRLPRPVSCVVTLGLGTGAIVAGGCFLYGLYFLLSRRGVNSLCLIVPFYTALWHGIRAVQLFKGSETTRSSIFYTLGGILSFGILGAGWSKKIYATLPDVPPSCFIVTAASRGHRQIVGPLFKISHHNGVRLANQQLLTLWSFEAVWRDFAPRSHALFRRVYNRFGPIAARQITSPWAADATYLLIKPIELAAQILLKINAQKKHSKDYENKTERRKMAFAF